MKIQLHKIRLENNSGPISLFFQQFFGWLTGYKQQAITVFDADLGIDLDVATLLPTGVFVCSCLTDDLDKAEQRLQEAGIPYECPLQLYPGCTTIRYGVVGRNLVEISMPEKFSSGWTWPD